ncbi:MAG: hypothetical protein HYZ27_06475, partial [Deltaproteobacteria bacterium]|nr:hypothetical protein [Deltaproteobacteria bacterium]
MTRFSIGLALVMVFGCSKRDSLGDAPAGVQAKPIKLRLETPSQMILGFNELSAIGVRVVYLDDTPAAGVEVSFTVNGQTGGAVLQDTSGTSGSDGRLQTLLTAGANRASFTVTVAAGIVSEVVQVDVDGVYLGKLRVSFAYNGLVSLHQITTRLVPQQTCVGLDPTQPNQVVAVLPAANPSTPVEFDLLDEQRIFTVAAVALGPTGDIAATGCMVAPSIIGRNTVQVTVPLALGPQNFVGTYDFGLSLHLNEALIAQDAVADLDAFFHDPANVIARELVDFVAAQTGMSQNEVESTLTAAWVFYALMNGLAPDADGDGEMLDDAVTYYLLDDMPAWVNDALLIGGDLTALLTDFSVGGKMHIASVDSAGALSGHWDWNEFLFNWRAGSGCDPTETCCGRVRLSGQEMGLVPVAADFLGQVTALNTANAIDYDLTIARHPLALEYGAIILFALNEWVLPEITGQSTLDCAVESLFGCDGLGQFACGAPNSSLTSDPCGCTRAGNWIDQALGMPGIGEPACDLAVAAAADQIESQLGALAWSGSGNDSIAIELAATWSDSDRDLHMDVFDGG